MVENSTAGLVMVTGEADITVTREERHQDVLAHYAPRPGGERRVAVELAWCAITTGKYQGQQAIEVRLDGRRAGELTHLMSQRYAPLVAEVTARSGRPGCEAVIQRDARGLQLTLRLPRDAAAVPRPVPSPADTPTVVLPRIPAPVAAAAPGTFSRHRTGWLVAAAVTAVLFFAAVVNGNNDDDPAPLASAADETTTTFALPTTTPTTTTTVPTTTTPPPPLPTTTTVAPPPPPVTQQPAPPVTQAPPVRNPAPQQQCDPNYSGCVPVASDVDCAGGSGNGPAYAEGPVQVVGNDIYGLDKDGDGTACE
jgi:hypothetical protein